MFKKIAISIIIIFTIIFTFYTIHASLNSDRYYMQGLKFEKEEKYQDAYYNFGKINRFSKIYPLGIYKQAKCAKILEDRKTAIKKYEKYTSTIKDDIMAPVGFWELGNLYYEEGKIKDAEKIFKKMEDKYPNNNYTYASYFRMGEILKDSNKENAKKYLIKYLEYAPLGRFSKKALQYIEEINLPLSDEDKIILSNALSQNEDSIKALSYINTVPQDKRWIQEYKIYKNNNDSEKALNIIRSGLALENSKIDESELKDAVNWYISKKISKDDIKNLFNETNKKGNASHPYIAIIYAQSLDNGYLLYSDILKSNSKYSDIALS